MVLLQEPFEQRLAVCKFPPDDGGAESDRSAAEVTSPKNLVRPYRSCASETVFLRVISSLAAENAVRAEMNESAAPRIRKPMPTCAEARR